MNLGLNRILRSDIGSIYIVINAGKKTSLCLVIASNGDMSSYHVNNAVLAGMTELCFINLDQVIRQAMRNFSVTKIFDISGGTANEHVSGIA